MNVNDKVDVVLTDRGRLVLYAYEVANGTPTYSKYNMNGSRLTVQLWTLMQIFGPEMTMGKDPVFQDNEVVIPKPDTK